MSIGPPIPEIQHFQNLTLKIKGQGQMTMMLHNYRSRQFHRTSNGTDPSRGFRDMGSAKSGPSADLTSFWPMGKPIWGKWANNYDIAQLQVQTSPWNFKWGQSIQRFQRYAFRKVWTLFVPNLKSFWPMGKPIWGKWANDHDKQLDKLCFSALPSLQTLFWMCILMCKCDAVWENKILDLTVHNYRSRQFHRTLNGENPSRGYRDMGSASLAAARPAALPPAGPWQQYPSSPEGWGVKRSRSWPKSILMARFEAKH